MGCSSCRSMERHNLCFFQFASEQRVSLACRVAPRLQLVWKRGPLAPVVVVGEGQVNLGFQPAEEPASAMVEVSKALWLI